MVPGIKARAWLMLIFKQRLSCPHWPKLKIFLLQPPEQLSYRPVPTDSGDVCAQVNCGSEWGLLSLSCTGAANPEGVVYRHGDVNL